MMDGVITKQKGRFMAKELPKEWKTRMIFLARQKASDADIRRELHISNERWYKLLFEDAEFCKLAYEVDLIRLKHRWGAYIKKHEIEAVNVRSAEMESIFACEADNYDTRLLCMEIEDVCAEFGLSRRVLRGLKALGCKKGLDVLRVEDLHVRRLRGCSAGTAGKINLLRKYVSLFAHKKTGEEPLVHETPDMANVLDNLYGDGEAPVETAMKGTLEG